MNLKYLGEREVRKIMKSLGMICHIYIYNVKQDLQPYTQLSPVCILMLKKCASRSDFKFLLFFFH